MITARTGHMQQDAPNQIHEDIESPEAPEPVRESRGTRSGLTRWVAERQAKDRSSVNGPSYERCQEKQCWGKATWTCPSCHRKSCSAHRPEHRCSLPYLPS